MVRLKQNVQQHIVTLLLLPSVTLMLQVLSRQHPLTRASTKLTIQSNPFCTHFPRENMGSDLLQCRSVVCMTGLNIQCQRTLVYWFCTKFCQLILRKIIKIDATTCQILRPKCTKFDFGWGSAPDPAGGAYSAPQTP